MKTRLRKIFSPVLDLFEGGDEQYTYKNSYRTILKVVGTLFLILSVGSLAAAVSVAQVGAGLPFLVFLCVGCVCLIVGFLGNDQAVAKIWRNR